MRSVLPIVLSLLSSPLAAQTSGAGRPGVRPLLAPDVEIPLARSAAPASVSARASVYVFTDEGFRLADSGSSDVACLVNRSWPTSLEPECFDREAARTIMRQDMKRTELYHRGASQQEADRLIADGLADGTFQLPTRPAVVYMMSAGQRLVSDDGRAVGKWRPHLMIYSPYLTNAAVGHHGEPGLSGGLVVDSGLPTANLMVVVPDFVKVPEASPDR
ncbi:MAG: hypothetical protein AB7R55_14935 [Gemmatimonadales bacterium]